ncbi:MAG: metallophosphoesterase [Candidatus Altiarchaeota archaeon]|nr:metallophosphoesterase [Candidatus Altiarchaeota archaeon]
MQDFPHLIIGDTHCNLPSFDLIKDALGNKRPVVVYVGDILDERISYDKRKDFMSDLKQGTQELDPIATIIKTGNHDIRVAELETSLAKEQPGSYLDILEMGLSDKNLMVSDKGVMTNEFESHDMYVLEPGNLETYDSTEKMFLVTHHFNKLIAQANTYDAYFHGHFHNGFSYPDRKKIIVSVCLAETELKTMNSGKIRWGRPKIKTVSWSYDTEDKSFEKDETRRTPGIEFIYRNIKAEKSRTLGLVPGLFGNCMLAHNDTIHLINGDGWVDIKLDELIDALGKQVKGLNKKQYLGII